MTLRFSESRRHVAGRGAGDRPERASGSTTGSRSAPTAAGRSRVALPDAGEEGTYVLTWRVVSEDAHPVSGVSTFSVGTAERPRREPSRRAATGRRSGGSLLARGLGYLRAAGSARDRGDAAARLAGGTRPPAAVRRLASTAWGLALAGSGSPACSCRARPLLASGRRRAFDGELLSAVLGTQYGKAHAARLVLLLLAGAGLAGRSLRARRDPGRRALVAAGLLAVPLVVTWPLSGHAAAGNMRSLAVPADALHLLAVGAWTGGLVVLLVGAAPRRDERSWPSALPRWSRLATVAVVVMVVTGRVRVLAGGRRAGAAHRDDLRTAPGR